MELARRLAEREIAQAISLPGLHDRQVVEDATLKNISLAVELPVLLAPMAITVPTPLSCRNPECRHLPSAYVRRQCLAD
jgi:hypothetical protein